MSVSDLDWLAAHGVAPANDFRVADLYMEQIPAPPRLTPEPDPRLPILQVFVPGRPVTKGSMKAYCTRGKTHKVRMEEDHADSKPWRKLMARTVRMVGGMDWAHPEEGAVRVELDFRVERKSHYESHQTPYPTAITIGDIDKLARNVLDALTDAGVYKDDSQVARLVASKSWAELTPDGRPRPGVQIMMWRL